VQWRAAAGEEADVGAMTEETSIEWRHREW
jgi:hypothetical protein